MPPAHQVARKVMHCMGIPRLLAPELCTALVAAGGFSDKNLRIFWSLCRVKTNLQYEEQAVYQKGVIQYLRKQVEVGGWSVNCSRL